MSGMVKKKHTILDTKLAKRLREELASIISEMDEQFMEYSSERAEEIHHSECDIKCCGSHEVVKGRCKLCKMTEKEIDDHNLEWWHTVDNVEGDDPKCIALRVEMERLNEVIKYLGGKAQFHH